MVKAEISFITLEKLFDGVPPIHPPPKKNTMAGRESLARHEDGSKMNKRSFCCGVVLYTMDVVGTSFAGDSAAFAKPGIKPASGKHTTIADA